MQSGSAMWYIKCPKNIWSSAVLAGGGEVVLLLLFFKGKGLDAVLAASSASVQMSSS